MHSTYLHDSIIIFADIVKQTHLGMNLTRIGTRSYLPSCVSFPTTIQKILKTFKGCSVDTAM